LPGHTAVTSLVMSLIQGQQNYLLKGVTQLKL